MNEQLSEDDIMADFQQRNPEAAARLKLDMLIAEAQTIAATGILRIGREGLLASLPWYQQDPPEEDHEK